MKNKKIVIVGGTDGIGRAIANALIDENDIIIIGRSKEKGEDFVEKSGPNANYLTTDLSLLNNIPLLVEQIKSKFDRVDYIVHTADIIRIERLETKEGLEISIALNYFSRVLFNQLMLDERNGFQPERIIHVAAAGFPPKKNFMDNFPLKTTINSFTAHTLGQWSNDFYGLHMKNKLSKKGTSINILNPGYVTSEIRKKAKMSIFLKLIFPIVGRIIIGKPQSPKEYARIPLAIMNNENSDANDFTMINQKGKGIKGNKHINNIKTQKDLYDFTQNKINSILKSNELNNWL